MTVDSGNIRFMRKFLGEVASNDSGVIKNVDFLGFRTLRLRQLRKWGQDYHIILFSSLLPFRLSTDPKMHDLEWLWMAWMAILRWIFTIM